MLRVVLTARGPGNSAETAAAAAIAPTICVNMTSSALNQPIAPIRANPRDTYQRKITKLASIHDPMQKTYRWVKKAPADAEENPNVDRQTEAESQCNIE